MQCRVGNAHAVSRKWGYLVSNASKYVLQTTKDVDDTIKLENDRTWSSDALAYAKLEPHFRSSSRAVVVMWRTRCFPGLVMVGVIPRVCSEP